MSTDHGRIGGRYEPSGQLGQGASGVVYAARDVLRQEDVALKLLPIDSVEDLEDARREVTAMRWLDLPGLARFRDDGVHEGSWFIAMDLVHGLPFPGARTLPVPWGELAPTAQALLEILARVHLTGVVHGDLKPANVLVSEDGTPTLVDFGLSTGRSVRVGPEGEGLQGTPLYMAPEGLMGAHPSVASDLYATGLLLYQALSGSVPHDDQGHRFWVRRTTEEIPLLTGVPDEVASAVARLLSREPSGRPGSALETLQHLGGRVPTPLALLPLGVAQLSVEHLRALFPDSDGFDHLGEDGARTLWERTGGHRRRVEIEVDAWLASGRATWVDGRITASRSSLESLRWLPLATDEDPEEQGLGDHDAEVLSWVRAAAPWATAGLLEALVPGSSGSLDRLRARSLVWDLPEARLGAWPRVTPTEDTERHRTLAEVLPHGTEARLFQLVLTRAPPEVLAEEALEVAASLLHNGRLARAAVTLDLALDQVQRGDHPDLELALLRERTILALSEETALAADEALYLVGRSVLTDPAREQLARLLRAARAVWQRQGERALELLDLVEPRDHEELEIWRQGLRMSAAGHHSLAVEQALLEEMRQWAAGEPRREAKLAGWEGNLRYRQSRFLEAAALHQRSLAARETVPERLAGLVNASMAHLDAMDFPIAASLAQEALTLARDRRYPGYECTATWLLRATEYRSGQDRPPRPDLVLAAGSLGVFEEGALALNEAAVAWRRGDLALARELASRARVCLAGDHLTVFAALARALELAAGGTALESEHGQLENLASDHGNLWPARQVRALLSLIRVGGTPLGGGPRREVLSQEECIRAMENCDQPDPQEPQLT